MIMVRDASDAASDVHCRYASTLLDAEEEEDVAGGGTSNSVYWHGRRGNLLEVREEVIADREGHRARAGKEDAGSNGASRRPSSNTMGGTGTKAGTTGGAAALPKTSELIRIQDAESKGQPGRGCGPMAAMLMYSACAEWTGLHCCGQVREAEFWSPDCRPERLEGGRLTGEAEWAIPPHLPVCQLLSSKLCLCHSNSCFSRDQCLSPSPNRISLSLATLLSEHGVPPHLAIDHVGRVYHQREAGFDGLWCHLRKVPR
jgi:hypothetical protein